MKEKISQINNAISSKSEQLKKQVDKDFDLISDDLSTEKSSLSNKPNKNVNTLLPKMLYVGSALFATGAIGAKVYELIKQYNSKEKTHQELSTNIPSKLSLAAMVSATGGIVLSRMKSLNSSLSASQESFDDAPKFDIAAIKNEVISKGIAMVKNITSDWDEFMEKNQKALFAVIDSLSLSESHKDELTSKIYSYEVIDINMSELMASVNMASSLGEIVERLETFKSKFVSAIVMASMKQKARYDSLNSE